MYINVKNAHWDNMISSLLTHLICTNKLVHVRINIIRMYDGTFVNRRERKVMKKS